MWALAVAAEFGALVPIIFAEDAPVEPADLVYRLVGGSFAAFGLVAWHRRPDSRSGPLMTATGFGLLVSLLLGFSIIVSLFGMVNTMVLSVFERTREIGMLRTIGMTRRQARRMIRHESVITALIGTALGLGLGLFLAGLVTVAAGMDGLPFAVPVQTLAAFTLVAVAAGIGAAILPARRASRLNVLEALQYE
jgi:ABC-type antimicrobial peptide transport system permease subunit